MDYSLKNEGKTFQVFVSAHLQKIDIRHGRGLFLLCVLRLCLPLDIQRCYAYSRLRCLPLWNQKSAKSP